MEENLLKFDVRKILNTPENIIYNTLNSSFIQRIATRKYIFNFCRAYESYEGTSLNHNVFLHMKTSTFNIIFRELLRHFKGNRVSLFKQFVNQRKIICVEIYLDMDSTLSNYITAQYIKYTYDRYPTTLQKILTPTLVAEFIKHYPTHMFKSNNMTSYKAMVKHIPIKDSKFLKTTLASLYGAKCDMVIYNSMVTIVLNDILSLDEDIISMIPARYFNHYYWKYFTNISESIVPCFEGRNRTGHTGISSRLTLLMLLAYGDKLGLSCSVLDQYQEQIYQAFKQRNRYIINIFGWIKSYVWKNYAQYIYLLESIPKDLQHLISFYLFM